MNTDSAVHTSANTHPMKKSQVKIFVPSMIGRRASVRALIRLHEAPDPLRHRVGDACGLEHQEDDQQREPEHEHHAEREQERISEHRDQAEAPDRDLRPPWLPEAMRTLSPAWPDRAA